MLKLLKFSLFIFLISLSSASDKPLYFIHSGPFEDGRPDIPHQTVIYRFDETAKELEQVWTLGKNIPAWDIRLYSGSDYILVAEGDMHPTRLHILQSTHIDESKIINLEEFGRNTQYNYMDLPADSSAILLKYLNNSNRLYLLGDNSLTQIPYNSIHKGQIRLMGYGIIRGKSDAIIFGKLPKFGMKALYTSYIFESPSVPDSIIQTDPNMGWFLIANEPDFLALLSNPTDSKETQRELLIYNRIVDTWSSLLIEGSATQLGLLNGWLVGKIADINPKNSRFIGHPPIHRNETVLINPLKNYQFTEKVGSRDDILLIENNIVYYRKGKELYKAQIKDADFVDKKLLITDHRVFFFYLAFRGK